MLRSDESAAPDSELYNALLPGMSTIAQAQLFGISSPYAKAGLLYNKHRDHFGADKDDILVIQAPSHVMNPVLDTRDRDRQMIEDPARARAEWFGEFRDDLVAFIDPATVDRCVITGRAELRPVPGIKYIAAVDPSGGSSDSMTLAIAHTEGDDRGILDFVGEWRAPFSPQQVVREIVDIVRRYNVASVVGDRYAGEWAREPFRNLGIEYQLSSMTRSEAYLTMLPAINSGKIELLDNLRLVSQLCALQRRTARSGKDSVDHPRGGHDDVINAAALALVAAALTPSSSADNWIEVLRRMIARGTTDVDDIRVSGPDFGFEFGSSNAPEPLIRLIVPRPIENGGGHGVPVGDRLYGLRFAEGRAYIEAPRADAIQLLQQECWRVENPDVARDLERAA